MIARPVLEFLVVVVVVATLLAAIALGVSTIEKERSEARWEFGCLDVTGEPVVRGPILQKYWMEQGTIHGLDKDGKRYYYRPPYGWLCVIQEVK